MPSISLGNIYSSGGRTVVGGSSSGIDTEGLIKSLTTAKRLPAVKLEDTIKANTTKIEAFGKMKTLLEDLQKASNFLRNVPGFSNSNDDAFAYSAVNVTASNGAVATGYMTATVAAGTKAGNYTVSVDRLATRQTYVTNTISVANQNTSVVGNGGAFNAGTLKLGTSGTQITLANGDTLNDVVSKINAVKTQSGFEASVVKVGDGSYRMTIKATATGAAQNFDFDTQNPGILNVGFSSKTDAVDALVTVDGSQVSRASNSVNDVIDGVTLNLIATTPANTTLNVSIAPDTKLAKDAIMNFVDAYNNFRAFAAEQNETDDSGGKTDKAILSGDTALRTLENSLGISIANNVPGLPDQLNSLAKIGITLTDFQGDDKTPLTRNILKVDEAILDEKLASDFAGVQKVFEFTATTDSSDLLVFSHSKNNDITNVKFDIDKTNNTYKATFTLNGQVQTIDLAATSVDANSISLKAADDSPLAGLTLIYGGPATATTVNMTMSQGLGDKIYNTLTDALNSDNGIVAQQIKSLNDRNANMEKDVSRIDGLVEQYREGLLTKFSALEAAIAAVNNILALLDAQAAARENS